MKKSIIFDVGGVVVFHDLKGFFSWVKERTGKDISDIHKDLCIKRDLSLIDEHEFFEKLGLSGISEEEYYDSYYSSFLYVDWELLDSIKTEFSEHGLFIFSNNSKVNIDNYGIDFSMFDGCVFSYDIGLRKPDREFFKKGLDMIGRKAKDCIFIDDNKVNCEVAEDIGIRSIQYLGLEHLKSVLDCEIKE